MNRTFIEQLEELVKAGHEIENQPGIDRWVRRVKAFLNTAVGQPEADTFSSLGSIPHSFDELGSMLGHLEG